LSGRARESELQSVRLLLLDAAQDPAAWPAALLAFAGACGGHVGQMIARDGADRLIFQLVFGIDPAFSAEADDFGFSDLGRNPRLRIGRRAALMVPVADQVAVDPETRSRAPIYAELYEPYEIGFNAQVVLHREPDLLVRASISRSKGPFASEDLETLEALSPYVQAAARQQLLAERRAVEGLLAAAEAAGLPLFVLNRIGRLVAASAAGQKLITLNGPFRTDVGRLRATGAAGARQLEAAVSAGLEAWAGGPFPAPKQVVVEDERGRWAFKVTTLAPRAFSLLSEPAVIVMGDAEPLRMGHLALHGVYGLGRAEAEVAQLLATGASPSEIAGERGVSIETVRSQIKSIFRKVGVHRLPELVVRLNGG